MITLLSFLAAVTFITEPPMPPSNNDTNVVLHEKISLQDDGKELGFVNWNSYRSDSSTAGIYSLYLKPEFRSKGYGKQLLKRAIDVIAQHGYSAILLVPGVMEMQNGELTDIEGPERDQLLPQRIKFYQSNGFVTDPYNDKQLVYYVGSTARNIIDTSAPWCSNYYPAIFGALTLSIIAILYLWWRRRGQAK